MIDLKRPILPRIKRRLWESYYNQRVRMWSLGHAINPPALNRLITFSGGIGDQLMCSALFRALRERDERDLWMMTRNPDLFWHNPDIDKIVYNHRYFVELAQKRGVFHQVNYTTHIRDEKRDMHLTNHFMANMASLLGISGEISLRPFFYLTPSEQASGVVAQRQIAVQSSVAGAKYPILTKEWYPKRMQQVVDELYPAYTIVQIGVIDDPPLQNTIDLRGKLSIRETAAILANSQLFIGQVGFLMHLARAVDCRAVIVYGGREDPKLSGYSAYNNIITSLPCSPCWLWDNCPIHRECLRQITSTMVIEAAYEQLALVGQPLPVERVLIPDPAQVPEIAAHYH